MYTLLTFLALFGGIVFVIALRGKWWAWAISLLMLTASLTAEISNDKRIDAIFNHARASHDVRELHMLYADGCRNSTKKKIAAVLSEILHDEIDSVACTNVVELVRLLAMEKDRSIAFYAIDIMRSSLAVAGPKRCLAAAGLDDLSSLDDAIGRMSREILDSLRTEVLIDSAESRMRDDAMTGRRCPYGMDSMQIRMPIVWMLDGELPDSLYRGMPAQNIPAFLERMSVVAWIRQVALDTVVRVYRRKGSSDLEPGVVSEGAPMGWHVKIMDVHAGCVLAYTYLEGSYDIPVGFESDPGAAGITAYALTRAAEANSEPRAQLDTWLRAQLGDTQH